PWKAPGATGIQVGVLRRAAGTLGDAMLSVYNRALHERRLPASWMEATMLPIPKDAEWNGDLKRVRPMMLLDTRRKACFRVLTTRRAAAIDAHTVLNEANVGFRAGAQPADKIMMVRAASDVCRRTKRTLYATQVDVKGAFDSVTLATLGDSLRRIRVPDGFIAL